MIEREIAVLTTDEIDSAQKARYEKNGVTFLVGDPTRHADLEDAKVRDKESIILLADDSADDPDAQTLVILTALREVFRGRTPHVCAEVKNQNRIRHVQKAGATEVVCHQHFGLGILAQAALVPHMSNIYHNLLQYSRDTSEFYVIWGPEAKGRNRFEKDETWDTVVGSKPFAAIAAAISSAGGEVGRPTLLIGFHRDQRPRLNPPPDETVQRTDGLIILAKEKPGDAWVSSLTKISERSGAASA